MADKVVGFAIQIKGTPQQQREIQQLERAVGILAQRRNVLNKNERQGNITTRQAAKARATLNNTLTANRNRLRDLNATVLKNNNALRKNSGFVSGLSKGLLSAGLRLGAVALGFSALTRVASSTVKIIKDFQQANANLAAVLGKTRSEITALTDDAKRLGAATAFTASEVVELQVEFAKLGFNEQEILAATEATLDLAAATGTDLANAASVSGSVVRAFGLDASETQRVVDVMAKSFSSTSLDIDKFSTAIASVAPVAASANVSLERTTALLGTLTDRGVDASTAGTGLRNIFLELAKRGITFEEAMAKINTASDKNAASLDLFGKRGATVGTILAATGKSVDELTVSFEDAGGAAERMANEQLDTLEGAATILNSTWLGRSIRRPTPTAMPFSTLDSLPAFLFIKLPA